MFNLKNISEIKGYTTMLNTNAKMFESFLNNFLNAWGTEARETIKPVSIKYVQEGSIKYLRFDYKIYGKKEWLHVMSPHTWY